MKYTQELNMLYNQGRTSKNYGVPHFGTNFRKVTDHKSPPGVTHDTKVPLVSQTTKVTLVSQTTKVPLVSHTTPKSP